MCVHCIPSQSNCIRSGMMHWLIMINNIGCDHHHYHHPTVSLAVGDPGPGVGRVVVVVGVSLGVQVVEENVHFVRGKQLRGGLHVVVRGEARVRVVVVGVRVLSIEDSVVVLHPPLLVSRYLHLGQAKLTLSQ